MSSRRIANVVAALAAASLSCKDEPSSIEVLRRQEAQPRAESRERANIRPVVTPVPYGQKIACAKMIDPAKISSALGKPMEMKDNSISDGDATAVCGFHLPGKPPSAVAQKRMFERNDRVMGVLPGDELCQVSVYCWYPFDVAEQKQKCKDEGQEVSTTIGELTCVRSLEAGENYRYVVSALDPDTKCKVVANGGPSVVDEATVTACARAAVDAIGPESLKVVP